MFRMLRRHFADKFVCASRSCPKLFVEIGGGAPGLEACAQAGVVRRFREADEPSRGFLLDALVIAVCGFCHTRLTRTGPLFNKRLAARFFHIVNEEIVIWRSQGALTVFDALDHQYLRHRGGDAQVLSDLLQGTAAEAVHFQGDAGPLGQLGDRRDHPPKLLPGDRFVFRRGRLVGDTRHELLYVPGRVAVFQGQAPPSVKRNVAHDAVEIADGFLQAAAMHGGAVAQPGLLHHVFREASFADDAVGVVHQRTSVRYEEAQGRRSLAPRQVSPFDRSRYDRRAESSGRRTNGRTQLRTVRIQY